MNLQTDRVENHRAQFTIEIEPDQLESAKQVAARKISRRVRIKGFRKGKAPYRLVAQYVGESAILEEALEALGDDLYKRALEESEVIPYGPGAFEEFKLEPAPTFIFSVPLQPEVDLQDYGDVRLDYEDATVDDEQVEQALRQMQMRAAEVTDADAEVAAVGNRVTIAVESEFIDGESPDDEGDGDDTEATEDALTTEDEGDDAAEESTDDAAEESTDVEAPYMPKKGESFIHDENAVIILDPNEDPFIHGFVDFLIGAERGSDVEFELTIPDDDEDETIAGRRVRFQVTMKQIEALAIPEIDDDFARQVSRNLGDSEMDLDGLRQATRADLERSATDEAKAQYSGKVLEQVVEAAAIDFPEIMLEEQIDQLVAEFERNLQQRRISLDEYIRLTNSSKEELREQYRERATQSLRQSLVLREFVDSQGIEIGDEQIEKRLDSVVAGYGSSPELRKLFDTPQMRDNVRNELMMSHINERMVAIGRGQDAATAIEALDARMAADAQRSRERSERLQRYKEEEETEAIAPDQNQDA